jgi:hypothetical protein
MMSFSGGSAWACAASNQSTTAVVTNEGSKPCVINCSTNGIAGRTWAPPVWNVQQRAYIENNSTAGSPKYIEGLVQTPSRAVLLSAHRNPVGEPLASTVIGYDPPRVAPAPRRALLRVRRRLPGAQHRHPARPPDGHLLQPPILRRTNQWSWGRRLPRQRVPRPPAVLATPDQTCANRPGGCRWRSPW